MRRSARTEMESEKHWDFALKVSIQEAKNLPNKRKYYCELYLDHLLYARTTSKMIQNTVFWSETFDLTNLPEIQRVTIKLFQASKHDDEGKRRRSNKGLNHCLGYVSMPVIDLPTSDEIQDWVQLRPASSELESHLQDQAVRYRGSLRSNGNPFSRASGLSSPNDADASPTTQEPPSSPVVGASPTISSSFSFKLKSQSSLKQTSNASSVISIRDGAADDIRNQSENVPLLRIKIKYQALELLPLRGYDELKTFLLAEYRSLVEYLEPRMDVKGKEQLASSLVNIWDRLPECQIQDLLLHFTSKELSSNSDISLIFRSNTIGSKALESYVKLVGSGYLQRLLKDFIENLTSSPEMDLEVDPSRLPNKAVVIPNSSVLTGKWAATGSQLYDNQVALLNAFSQVWSAIQNSLEYFPRALQETFGILRKCIEREYPADTADRLLSSCLFLRFICPAILGPMLFGLANSLSEDPKVTRNLTLVAKALQTLANLARFEDKEFYMRFLNDFVCGQHEEMRRFLRVISMPLPPKRIDESLPDARDHHQFIHINYEFARLHALLCDFFKDQSELPAKLQRLPTILDAVNGQLSSGTLDTKSSLTSLPQAVEAEQLKCPLNGISEHDVESSEVIYCNDSALQKMREQNQFVGSKLHSNIRWPSGPELSKVGANGLLLEPKLQNKEHVLRIGSLPTTPQKKKLSGAFRACSMRQNSIPHSSGDEYFSPTTTTTTNNNNNGSASVPGPRMGTRAIQLSRERLHVSPDCNNCGSPSPVTRSNNEATDVNSLHSMLQRQEMRMVQAETRLSECNSEIARLHAHIDELQRLNSQPRNTIDGCSQLSDSDQFSTTSQGSLNRPSTDDSFAFWNTSSYPSDHLQRRLDELQSLIERGYSELEELTGQMRTKSDCSQDCPNFVQRMQTLNQDLCKLKENYEHLRSSSFDSSDQRTPTMPTKMAKNPSQSDCDPRHQCSQAYLPEKAHILSSIR